MDAMVESGSPNEGEEYEGEENKPANEVEDKFPTTEVENNIQGEVEE